MVRKNRNTKQKELLEQHMKTFQSFFNAEDLFDKVKKHDQKLGIATVYRFLKEQSENHHLHSYQCEKRTIYSLHDKSHCHFTCEKCGKVSHIKVDSIDFLKKKMKGSICHFQIDVSGVCENCS